MGKWVFGLPKFGYWGGGKFPFLCLKWGVEGIKGYILAYFIFGIFIFYIIAFKDSMINA